ncbi:MAG: superoxide dismutase family protein [Gammaproteobacteria bacterium]
MKTRQAQRASVCAISLLASSVIAGCGGEPESAIDAPPAARIGNVATAELQPVGDSGVTGMVTFAELDDALRVEATVMGLSKGQHGLHLHEFGDCSAPDASSAGGHFSPDDDPHGAPSDAVARHHAGDLGNLTADADGTAHIAREDSELTLVGEYGVVGRAVVVHRGADDLTSQQSGDSGERVACGVIEWGTNASPERAG